MSIEDRSFDEIKAAIVDTLCSQALADHLGDVRDAERALWKLLDVPELSSDHPQAWSDSAYRVTAARLQLAGFDPPSWSSSGWSDDDDEE